MRKKNKLFTALLVALLLGLVMSGCDKTIKDVGTQSADVEITDTTTDIGNMVEENTPPVAYAGKDQKVEVGETATLSATNILDADDDLLQYIWTLTDKPARSRATIDERMKRVTSFVADVFGTYKVRLMIGDGEDYSFDIVEISTFLNASDFSVSLPREDIEVTQNWKDASNTNDPNANAYVVSNGTDGICTVQGDMLIYNESIDRDVDDSCVLNIYNYEESVQVTVTINRSLYEFSGIKLNLPIADLNGWEECYSTTYGDRNGHDEYMVAACTKDKIMLACRDTGSNILRLAAYADHDEVFLNTGNGGNTVHTANGVDWYYSSDYSMGFAPVGQGVSRHEADVRYGADRLSWHTLSWHPQGYRCGNTRTNSSQLLEKVIYQAD